MIVSAAKAGAISFMAAWAMISCRAALVMMLCMTGQASIIFWRLWPESDIFVIDFTLLVGHDIILDFKLGEDKIFFHSHEEGDFGDIRENGNDLEFYVDHGDREVLAGVMLNVAKDDFYAGDSLAFVEIAVASTTYLTGLVWHIFQKRLKRPFWNSFFKRGF